MSYSGRLAKVEQQLPAPVCSSCRTNGQQPKRVVIQQPGDPEPGSAKSQCCNGPPGACVSRL